MDDEKFREKLDEFSRRIDEYSQACNQLEYKFLPTILEKNIQEIFNVKSNDKPNFNVKYASNDGNFSVSRQLINDLRRQLTLSEIIKDSLGNIDKSEVSNILLNIDFMKVDRSSRFRSSDQDKITMLWESCLKTVSNNKTYQFVLEENDKLLEETKKIEKELSKCIEEPWRI